MTDDINRAYSHNRLAGLGGLLHDKLRVWTWRKDNRLGAIMIFLVAVLTVVLPVYILIFREV